MEASTRHHRRRTTRGEIEGKRFNLLNDVGMMGKGLVLIKQRQIFSTNQQERVRAGLSVYLSTYLPYLSIYLSVYLPIYLGRLLRLHFHFRSVYMAGISTTTPKTSIFVIMWLICPHTAHVCRPGVIAKSTVFVRCSSIYPGPLKALHMHSPVHTHISPRREGPPCRGPQGLKT